MRYLQLKPTVCSVLFLASLNGSAQKYYPKLNNLFLENSGEESLFGPDINYFRDGLRAANNKIFYGSLQTSNNQNVAFYSLKIIPRFVFESDLLKSGIILKFNVSGTEEHPSFPITYDEYANFNDSVKNGKGSMTIGNNGLSLAFPDNQISSPDATKKP